MVFSSLLFLLLFLPVSLICYFSVKSIKARNIILLTFSLVFYAWGEPVYVLILLGMSFFCWLFSLRIQAADENTGRRKVWMAVAAAVCIGSIGFFKYTGFIVSNINLLAGRELLSAPAIELPIGISFYTFQLLTYVVDVYRGEVPAQKKYWKVLLYAGLFHQCVAGPIVRYGDIENELTNRVSNINSVSRGTTRFMCGLAKKVLLANICGSVVDALLLSDADIGSAAMAASNAAVLSGRSALTLWVGMAFYMLQIYLDFSAYSDMAIGMGLICGFRYKENFDYPYMSTSVTEFWRRWHISLGTFFRDYVYIPLGGSRCSKPRNIFNIFVVWALTGLWHGASWNFVLWGLYFFVFLMLEKLFLLKGVQDKWFGRLYLLIVVYFGWIFFKFTDISLVAAVFKGMFCLNGNPLYTFESVEFIKKYILFFVIAVLACTPVVKKTGERLRKAAVSHTSALYFNGILNTVMPAVLFILSVLFLVGDSYNPFLYFQF